jgi:hypothetical protein
LPSPSKLTPTRSIYDSCFTHAAASGACRAATASKPLVSKYPTSAGAAAAARPSAHFQPSTQRVPLGARLCSNHAVPSGAPSVK